MKLDIRQLNSDRNRALAQLNQLKVSDLFSEQEKESLEPIYAKQIEEINLKISLYQKLEIKKHHM